MEISASTRVCAVIGDPVHHSLSPQIHNAAFRALDLDFVYVAYHVPRGRAVEALRAVRALGIRGLSVTIPHKLDVIAGLDEIDDVARGVGSVNTVIHDDGHDDRHDGDTRTEGRLSGISTDGPGALRALAAAGVDPAGRAVLLLGSGGAARAVAFSLAMLAPQPRLEILGVDARERQTLANDLAAAGCQVPHADLGAAALEAAMARAEIVVHATPVGMHPRVDQSVVPAGLIRDDQVVFDVVYTPHRTKLLADAEAAGAQTVPGLGMFVHQAAIQFERWTGRDAPVDVMEAAVREALRERT